MTEENQTELLLLEVQIRLAMDIYNVINSEGVDYSLSFCENLWNDLEEVKKGILSFEIEKAMPYLEKA